MNRLTVQIAVRMSERSEWLRLRPAWEQIYNQLPEATAFSCAEWVDAWLSTVGRTTSAEFLQFEEGHAPIAICLLAKSQVRRGPFSVSTHWFGTAGEPETDSVFVEFGDILCRPGREAAFAEAFLAFVRDLNWDEFIFPRMNPSLALDAIIKSAADYEVLVEKIPSRFVNLDEFRDPVIAFEESLPRKLRQQLRQSFRIFQELGPVSLRAAASTEEAVTMLEELASLHEASWKARGFPRGAFGSEAFCEFHRQIIRSTFADGGVHLLRITAGQTVVGLVYNIVSRGISYYYQSGLSYHLNSRVKPGFISQVMCVNYSRDAGLKVYDFMGGDTPYKRELGKDSHDLITVTLRRQSLKMRGIETARTLNRYLKNLLGRSGSTRQESP